MKFSLAGIQPLITSELDDYVKSLIDGLTFPGYQTPADFSKLPGDVDLLAAVNQLALAKNPGGLKWLILIGIGGSSLGAAAVHQALAKVSQADLTKHLTPLTVLDTIDPVDVAEVLTAINRTTLTADEILVVMVSKSGVTVETAANAADDGEDATRQIAGWLQTWLGQGILSGFRLLP